MGFLWLASLLCLLLQNFGVDAAIEANADGIRQIPVMFPRT